MRKILSIIDQVSFESTTIEDLRKSFQEAVDDYLVGGFYHHSLSIAFALPR
jgi:hypothetical protein